MKKEYGKDYFGKIITELKDVTPPSLCVPWFHEHFSVGDGISFYDTDGGGSILVEGVITGMEHSDLVVNGKSYLMGYINKVSKWLISENDFKYRVKLTIDLGESVDPDGRVSESFTTEVKRGVFTYIGHAVDSLRSKVSANPKVSVGYIQIKGALTNGEWERIVYVKQGEPKLTPCVLLKEEIWRLFKPYEETNVVSYETK